MTKTIAPWPCFSEEEISAVKNVLLSGKVNYWTGDECKTFEKEFASYVGRKYAIALANGSLALELALIGYDIGPGDEVIVSCRSFMASASCAIMRGATPVFADVDRTSQNISVESIKSKITNRTKAIICVHLAGWPCDMDAILKIAEEHNLIVIEDCAQAHGAKYKNSNIGSMGHISAFSFCQDKIMTTGGEGGMLLTDDETVYKKCWAYKEHGKSFDKIFNEERHPGFHWCIESFGTNWRMTEIQAVIGILQLKKLNNWVEQRRANSLKLKEAFGKSPLIRITEPESHIYHSYYKFYVFINPEMLKPDWNRNNIIENIEAEGIYCGSGSCGELYLEKAFKDQYEKTNFKPLPIAHELAETSLMFMVHPTLTDQDLKRTIEVCTKVFKQACKE
ncbi:MAG: DegT/DnrJ/EryC1/StrS family aminotransferase [Candidatus Ozemobacteraceae bacterium]|jgi:dTDP-4-amino-4,6-dideoxygalactose transaminase|nr:DegT/DnrJ/EryC1/StrS aminotransferase family protein [Candidatus Riflebacteria bacterium]